jgi:hypothetical protein
MPHFSNRIVEPDGPLINVTIGVSAQRKTALLAAGLPVPNPVFARVLIDTGASMTSIDQQILLSLQMQPTGSVQMHTPSTGTASVAMSTYDVELHFTGYGGGTHTFPTLGVLGCDFSAQNIDGLFARDALAQGRFFYSGPDNQWMLSL